MHEAILQPLRQRLKFIKTLASANTYYTEQEWHQWYADKPLCKTHMDDAVKQWKHEFPMRGHTRDAITEYEAKHTRNSNSAAKNLLNGAFAAYLQQTSINKQLALACLKSPSTIVDILLEEWTEYMHSQEHEREKARARHIPLEDEEGQKEHQQRYSLKIKVHALKHQLKLLKHE